MSSKLRVILIERLREEGMERIANAVVEETTSKLSKSEKETLIRISNVVRDEHGYSSHSMSFGIAGTSPASGNSGRFIEILE